MQPIFVFAQKTVSYKSEYLAVRELEELCDSVDVYGFGQEAYWENGRLTVFDDDDNEREIAIPEVWIKCDILSAEIIEKILQLPHLRSLNLQFSSAEDVPFPFEQLKMLEKVEISMMDNEAKTLPTSWGKSLCLSKNVRTLSIYGCSKLIPEVGKMTQLYSLRIDADDESDILSHILPLKNSLHELILSSSSEPSVGEVLKRFSKIQSLILTSLDSSSDLDLFLMDIKNLPLRCLWIPYGKIGKDGLSVLQKWKTLEEVILPCDLSQKYSQSLENVRISVALMQKDGSKQTQSVQKFFPYTKMEEISRDERLDAEGNYIHWADVRSDLWL
ncbi:MAG: hypothetical protein Q4C70_03660 [Planctomycetia bacterium]|nr:hypothetical protein [Planctomycetia bacterium]